MADEGLNPTEPKTAEPDTPPVAVVTYEKYQALLDEMKKKEAKLTDILKKEEKEKEELAKKNGEFEKLYNETKPIAEQAELLKQQLQALQDERKAELLSKLPKDKAERYKDFDIQVISQIVSDFAVSTLPQSPGVGGQTAPAVQKSFGELTPSEQSDLYKSNPAAYEKLLKEHFIKYNLG